MDSDLSFDDHISEKVKVGNKILGIIKRNCIDLGKDTCILLYKSMVRRHLEYAGSLWNPYKKDL